MAEYSEVRWVSFLSEDWIYWLLSQPISICLMEDKCVFSSANHTEPVNRWTLRSAKPPYLDLATTGFKQKNTAHFDCHAHLIHQPVQHFRFFCCVVFWKTQMSMLHKGYLRPSYHGFLSYSKPRTGCVYLGPCRLLPRQQELLQHCFPCLLIFFFCVHKQPTRECQKTCKSSICGDQMVDPQFVHKCLPKLANALKLTIFFQCAVQWEVPFNKSVGIASPKNTLDPQKRFPCCCWRWKKKKRFLA